MWEPSVESARRNRFIRRNILHIGSNVAEKQAVLLLKEGKKIYRKILFRGSIFIWNDIWNIGGEIEKVNQSAADTADKAALLSAELKSDFHIEYILWFEFSIRN